MFLPGRSHFVDTMAAAEPPDTPSTAAATATAHRPNLGGDVSPGPSAAPATAGSGKSSRGRAEGPAKGARDGDEESSCRSAEYRQQAMMSGTSPPPTPGGAPQITPPSRFRTRSRRPSPTLRRTRAYRTNNRQCRIAIAGENGGGKLIRNIALSRHYTCGSGLGATY